MVEPQPNDPGHAVVIPLILVGSVVLVALVVGVPLVVADALAGTLGDKGVHGMSEVVDGHGTVESVAIDQQRATVSVSQGVDRVDVLRNEKLVHQRVLNGVPTVVFPFRESGTYTFVAYTNGNQTGSASVIK